MKPPEKKKTPTAVSGQQSSAFAWMPWALGAIAILAYAGTLGYNFVLDDVAVITQNEFVKQGFGGIPELLSTSYWDGYWDQSSGLFRPLPLIMFAIEYAISPENPVIHHFVNIVLYAGIGVLAFRTLTRIFPVISGWPLLLGLVFFMVHPTHTEVVANIKSRDELLALFFFLGTCYFLFAKEQRSFKHVIFAALCLFLALLSKEGVAVLLPVIFWMEWKNNIPEKRWISMAALGVMVVVWWSWRYGVLSQYPPAEYTYHDNSLLATDNVLLQKSTALGLYGINFIKTIFPYVLSYDYSFPQIPLMPLSDPVSILGLLALLLTAGIGFWALIKKNALLVFAMGLIVFPLVLASHLVFPIGTTMADRLLFVPGLGVGLLIAWTLSAYAQYRKGIIGLVALVSLIFFVQTWQRNRVWAANETLFTEDVTHAPNSARVHFNYATLLQQQLGSTFLPAAADPALAQFDRAVRLDPGYLEAYINRGRLLQSVKRYEDAATNYREGLKRIKNDPTLLGGLGESFYRIGQKDSALVYLRRALDNGNDMPGTFEICGTLEFEQKHLAQAEKHFRQAVEKYPEHVNLRINYGNSLAAQEKYAPAIVQFEKARTIDGSNPRIYFFLAMCYEKTGDTLKAAKYRSVWQNMTSTQGASGN